MPYFTKNHKAQLISTAPLGAKEAEDKVAIMTDGHDRLDSRICITVEKNHSLEQKQAEIWTIDKK